MINLLEMLKIFLNIAKMLLSISNSRRWQKIKKYIYENFGLLPTPTSLALAEFQTIILNLVLFPTMTHFCIDKVFSNEVLTTILLTAKVTSGQLFPMHF